MPDLRLVVGNPGYGRRRRSPRGVEFPARSLRPASTAEVALALWTACTAQAAHLGRGCGPEAAAEELDPRAAIVAAGRVAGFPHHQAQIRHARLSALKASRVKFSPLLGEEKNISLRSSGR